MSDLYEDLKLEFQDEDYRYGYAESFLNTKLAVQIKTLRDQRGKTQAEVAALIGIKQPGFQRFEDINHSVWKTDTLWSIAKAFGVRLNISFDTFGSLLDEKKHFTKESLKRPSFEEDRVFKEQTNEDDKSAAAAKARPGSSSPYPPSFDLKRTPGDFYWDPRLPLSIASGYPIGGARGELLTHVGAIEQTRKGAALAETAHQIELTPMAVSQTTTESLTANGTSSGANVTRLVPVIPINMGTARKRRRSAKRGGRVQTRSVSRGARYA